MSLLLCLWLSGSCLRQSLEAAPVLGSKDVKAILGFSFYHNSIVVPLRVEGHDYPFMIDTGASRTMFDKSLRSLLGRRIPIRKTVEDNTPVETFRWPAASFGGNLRVSVPRGKVWLLDLTPVRAFSGPVSGMLGMDYLSSQIVHLDFQSMQLSILKKIPSNAGKAIPLARGAKNMRFVSLGLPDGKKAALVVDTGDSREIRLTPKRYDEYVSSGRITGDTATWTATPTGYKQTRFGVLDFVEFGGDHYEKIVTCRTPRAKGTIGAKMLSRYQVTFDFRNNTMYLAHPEPAPVMPVEKESTNAPTTDSAPTR